MLTEVLKQIEETTGFFAYETSTGNIGQFVFYGTSDKYDSFKTMVGDVLPTGTMVYLIDTSESHIYSKFKKIWY